MKMCERDCGYRAKSGSRFCKVCESKVLQEMKDDGYLQPKPFGRNFRNADARENRTETKHGIDL